MRINAGETPPLRPHQTSLIAAALISLLLWIVPVFGFVLLPLQYLNVHLHEFSHALMAKLSGGEVAYIHAYSNGSGLTYASGSPFLVNSAGYIGATILGGLMIWFSRSPRGAAVGMRVMACLLLFSFIFWVRGDMVGIIAGLVWMAVLFGLPHVMSGTNLVFVAQLIGMQQCLASIQSLYVLFRISAFGRGHSDAANMERYTGIPALFWAALWGVVGLGALYVTLRASWTARPDP